MTHNHCNCDNKGAVKKTCTNSHKKEISFFVAVVLVQVFFTAPFDNSQLADRMNVRVSFRFAQWALLSLSGCILCILCVTDAAYTAWDSEIESLTSLIKLHQSKRRSAPCGQIGAATQ